MLGEILALIQRVLSLLTTVVGLITGIKTAQDSQALQTTSTQILLDTQAIELVVDDGTYGLAALQAQIATLQATLALDVTAILTAIAAVQQAGQPVTLPSTYPSGWSTQIGTDAGSGVWAQIDPLTNNMYGYEVGYSYLWTTFYDGPQWPTAYNGSAFAINPVNLDDAYRKNTPGILPLALDLSGYGSGSSVLALVSAQNPAITWSLDNDGYVTGDWPGTSTEWSFHAVCMVTDWMLTGGVPATARPTAPVWPGLANVTLGATLSLADQMVVPGPLDGVIVSITSVPYPASYYPFGGMPSFVKVGGIGFVDDNGQMEITQPFGPQQEVVCPKSMSAASSANVRLLSGTVGTVTPFTVN